MKLLPYILFEKHIYILALKPGEPALCQLYRRTFVAYNLTTTKRAHAMQLWEMQFRGTSAKTMFI